MTLKEAKARIEELEKQNLELTVQVSRKVADRIIKDELQNLGSYWLKILDSLPIVVYINEGESCMWVNAYCEEVSGYTREEWMNQKPEEFFSKFHPDDLNINGFKYKSVKYFPREDSPIKVTQAEYRMKKKNGDWMWVYSTIAPLDYDEFGNTVIIVGTAVDITERKKSEDEIRKLNEELIESNKREMKLHQQKQELLREELELKQKQLVQFTINLAEKHNCLVELKNQAKEISSSSQNLDKRINNIISSINSRINSENHWLAFEIEFQNYNPHFQKKLIGLCPDLSIIELRIATLIKINMKTKEIASILHLSERTIETHRLHIRKKLNLSSKEQLASLLVSL
jgi:PAS domain S-box-containing protein